MGGGGVATVDFLILLEQPVQWSFWLNIASANSSFLFAQRREEEKKGKISSVVGHLCAPIAKVHKW